MNSIHLSLPRTIMGRIKLPASKSICNRVLMIHALSHSQARIENLSDCDDTNVIVSALREPSDEINIGAAGTAMRFLTAFLAMQEGRETTITGTERMKKRPIGLLVEALRALGADITYIDEEDFPPLRIKGRKLQGGTVSIAGDTSSQYISALLMIAPYLENGLRLELTGKVISLPYIRLTVELMKQFGAEVSWEDTQTLLVRPVHYLPKNFYVESDWSAASYWYSLVALTEGSCIRLSTLFPDSLQGDSACASLFSLLGVHTSFEEDGSVVLTRQGEAIKHWEQDFLEQPDLVQTFVVTCCLLGVHFHFTGLQSLRIKETDRINALEYEMQKLGYLLTATPDTLAWRGERCEAQTSPTIHTYEDHRMAMAFAPAACRLDGINIAHPHVVSKSYPCFWEDIESIRLTSPSI